MKKVLVIGDSCTDIFLYGNCERICPEAPVPVLIPVSKKQNCGMACNVYENLKALDVDCEIVTNRIRPIKKRFIDEGSNQMILRVDRRDKVDELDTDILEKIDLSQYYAILISDYDKGFLTREHIRYLTEKHPLTFIDTKKILDEWVDKVKYIKINEKEYHKNWNYFHKNSKYHGHLIVTRGKNGAILDWHRDIDKQEFPIYLEHPVRDLTGAGDTFIAGLVAKYIENNDINDSIIFANKCAAWAVTQKGVSVVNKSKINKD